ncbi:hypothetical protein LPJ61_000874 [Coemansia biformis]|uniref:Uncharacterized protein n=1 Tax=Coemansia biformis TaxID=1286918 RepID=A0A9W7YFF9_9FUNG|nr:hypothetical protein LPJ61_000874 [Coemansia biformis]
MGADIRATRPYFRFKRGALTLFIEARATEKMAAVRARLAGALQALGGDDAYAAIGPGSIQLLAPQPGGAGQFRVLAGDTRVDACGLEDDAVVHFVLQLDDGTWEEPRAADYDADVGDMDVAA